MTVETTRDNYKIKFQSIKVYEKQKCKARLTHVSSFHIPELTEEMCGDYKVFRRFRGLAPVISKRFLPGESALLAFRRSEM